MTPDCLFSDLVARGVEFMIDGDKLRFRPADRVTPAEVAMIRQHKAALLRLCEGREAAPIGIEAAPIVEGTEHFSIWVDDPDGSWPEFIPGYHHDIRQPSRLRPLLSHANKETTMTKNANGGRGVVFSQGESQ